MKEFKWKKVIWVVLVAAATLLWYAFRSQQSAVGSDSLSDPLKRGAVIRSVYGIGTVRANHSFQFKPGIITTVTRLYVKEGDVVASGQKLMELDRGVVLTAPFDGTITSLPVKIGENVFTQTVVLEVVDMLDRYVTVSLEQRAAIQVRRGQKAKLSFENLREESYDGTVESVYSNQDDFLVRIEASDLPPQILPGMTADVAIHIQRKEEALLVPVAAIQAGAVRVHREGGEPLNVPVQTGIVDGAFAEVISGEVKPGDRLLLPVKTRP